MNPLPRCADWSALDTCQRINILARPPRLHDAGQLADVRAIIAAVRARGDTALREIGLRLDRCELATFEVGAAEFTAAERAVDAGARAAMRRAIARVEAFHAA